MTNYLMVETYPSHPARVDEFNRWYEEVHVPEVVGLGGIRKATRLAPANADSGGFVTLYELDAEPDVVIAALTAAAGAGKLNMSDVMSMGPVPTLRVMQVYSEYTPPAAG